MPNIGDKIRIINNLTGHHFNIGSVYIVFRIEGSGIIAYDDAGNGGSYLISDEYEVIYDTFSINSLENREKELLTLIEKCKYVINYLEENQIEECSSNEINADLMVYYLKTNRVKELTKILNEINCNLTIDKLHNR